MLTKKRKIIISVIVIGIGFIMAILYFANKSKNKSAEILSEKTKITPSITRPLKFPQGKISVEIQKNNKHKESGKSTTSPVVVVKPFSQKPYFDNKNKLELEQNKDKKTNKPKNKVVLSEKEIFEKLYPSSFRDILLELQDFMISEGVLEERERVNFQTEDEIMDFAKKAIKFFEQKKVISSEDAKRFIEIGIPQWRKIKHQEAENLRQGKPQGVIGFYKKVLNNSICQQSQRSFNLSENIRELFFGEIFQPAFAAAVPLCPPCFKYGAGIGPFPGVALWAPTCDDWMLLLGKIPVPTGCLNKVCVCCNAIWDCTTGICGCDM